MLEDPQPVSILIGLRGATGKAVTGYSQEIQNYDRATEFEAIGGKLLEHTAVEWRELVES